MLVRRGVSVFATLITFSVIVAWGVAAEAELEILPAPEQHTRPVGEQFFLTCRPKVPEIKLISHLEWKNQNGIVIRNVNEQRRHGNPQPDVYTELFAEDMTLTLFFESVSEAMAGRYTCSAKYSNTEELEKSVQLQTIVAITWKDAPEQQYPIAGNDYKVKCEVEASPAPKVDWQRNGEPIVTSTKYVVETKGLLIKNVKESDDGIYTCRASVAVTGQVSKRNIKVEVHTPPKLVNNTLARKYDAIEDETVNVICKATGKPPPVYTWIKESTRENLAQTDRFFVDKNTGALTIKNVHQEDRSIYRCIAENKAGRVEQTTQINVRVKPKIYEFRNISRPENEEVKLICKATGWPLPKITFRKFSNVNDFAIGPNDNNRITADSEFFQGKDESIGILRISKLLRSDDGLYECVATNNAARSVKNGHLTVEFKPSFKKSENQPPVWTWDRKPANLSCLAESIPNATIEWFYGNLKVEEGPYFRMEGKGPRSNLIVTPYDDRFYTAFKCVARNIHGESSHIIELRKATIPKEVPSATIKKLSATSVEFDILVPAPFGNLPTEAITAEFKDSNQQDWKFSRNRTWSLGSPYVIEYLNPLTIYSFRFAAHNKVGKGPWGGYMELTTPTRSAPQEPHFIVTVQEGEVITSPYGDRYELVWKIPADNGERIDFYEIKYCPVVKVNGDWRENRNDCGQDTVSNYDATAFSISGLRSDTYYRVELRAHNRIGYSSPAQQLFKTAHGSDPTVYTHDSARLSSSLIIGIVVASVVIILIIIDVSCFCVNRAGILWLICDKARSKPIENEEDAKLGRDEKEPLKPPTDRTGVIDDTLKRNTSAEFNGHRVYTKTGDTIIGKNSAV